MTESVTATSNAPLLAAINAERALLVRTPKVWVALSGGADSTALLHALIGADLNVPIGVTHIDHCVQPDSKNWSQSCRDLCAQLGVPAQVHRVAPPRDGHFAEGFEAWARAQRYNHWRELLGEGEVLLCAHHADDQTETVALRLLQGRVPLPIPGERTLGRGLLLRPFLSLRRAQLRAALSDGGRRWLEDPSNSDTRLLRNRVRALLPELETLQASQADWQQLLARCGALHARRQRALNKAIGAEHGSATTPVWGEVARVPLAHIAGPTGLQGVLACFGSGPVSGRQANAVLTALREQAARGAKSGSAQGGVSAGVFTLHLDTSANAVVLWRDPVFLPQVLSEHDTTRIPAADTADKVTALRTRVELPHGTLTLQFAESMDLRKVGIRPLAPADRILHGGRLRSVKGLLRSIGVPRWARPSYPCVLVGDVLVAIPGPAIAASRPVTATPGWLREGGAASVPLSALWQGTVAGNLPS